MKLKTDNIMRRLLSFLAVAMLAISAMAQPSMPTFRFGETNKGFDHLMSHNSHILAEKDGEILVATYENRSFLGSFFPCGLQVVAADTNMKVLRQVSLPETKMSQIVFANYVDGKVYLLYRGVIVADYYRAVIDPQSMTLERCEKVFDNIPGKNLETYNWSAQSDNGLFYAVADVFVNSVSNEMVHRQLLLDEKLELMWEKHFEADMMSNLHVSDDGVVYLFGSRYDKASHETIVSMHVLDVDDEKSVERSVKVGEVYRLTLLNIVGSGGSPSVQYAVAAGYIRTPKSPKNKDCFDQMVGIALNLRTGDVKASTERFTSDELNVFGNKSTKKENEVGMVDALTMANSAETGYGGVLLLQRIWKVTTSSTSSPDVNEYFTMGSLALAVDTTGTILWHKPFRTVNSERTFQAADIPCYGDAPMLAEGDNVYVMLPEPAKPSATYDIASSESRIALGIRAHSYVIYGIDRQGTLAKQIPIPKDKGSLMDNFVRQAPGKYIGIYSYHKESNLVHVNF